MALMKFREPNQVRWQGVRPAHDGERFGAFVSLNGVGWNAVLPVHATMTRYVTYFYMGMPHNLVQRASLAVRNDVAAVIQQFGDWESVVANPGIWVCQSFWPPVEVPPNWTIDMNLSVAAWTRCGVLGWRE